MKLGGMTYQVELSKKVQDIKKNKIVFEKLGLIIRPNNI